ANLYRRHPAQVEVRYDVTRVMQREVYHVRRGRVDVTVAGDVNGDDVVIEEMVDDRQVVRPEVPQAIHVGLEQAEVHAHGVEVANSSEFAGIDPLPDGLHRAGKKKRVIHHQDAPHARRKINELLCLDDGGTKWLFDKDVLALA